MTREELKQHCEKQVKQCEMWAEYKHEVPGGKVYEEHKLILELLDSTENMINATAKVPDHHLEQEMTLDEWEKLNIFTLTSEKMGEWLYRRDMRRDQKRLSEIEAIFNEMKKEISAYKTGELKDLENDEMIDIVLEIIEDDKIKITRNKA